MSTKLIALVTLSVLTACGGEAADVAEFERSEVTTTIVVGAPYAQARSTLEHLGYTCKDASGSFVAENKQTVSVPSFLGCSKQTRGEVFCSIHTQVIVVPDDAKIGQVHFHADNACL